MCIDVCIPMCVYKIECCAFMSLLSVVSTSRGDPNDVYIVYVYTRTRIRVYTYTCIHVHRTRVRYVRVVQQDGKTAGQCDSRTVCR